MNPTDMVAEFEEESANRKSYNTRRSNRNNDNADEDVDFSNLLGVKEQS